MSSKHRHGLPKKKPERPAKDEIDAELPTLEPVAEELPTLEPVADVAAEAPDDGPVKVLHGQSNDASFDIELAVEVPTMDKKAVAEAVAGPLRRAAAQLGPRLRHQRVLVRFHGDAMIGSAVKELVGEILKPQKPRKVTLRRGYGDETVHEGALPQVKVETAANADRVDVAVATGELEAIDLPVALQSHLAHLAIDAKAKRFVLQFSGAAKPDAAVRDLIRDALQTAGAARVAIGARVLFDAELAGRVKVTKGSQEVVVAVDPAPEESDTRDALAMVLPEHTAAMAGKVVRLQFARPPRVGEREFAVESCRKFEPQRIELTDPAMSGDIVWPKLLQVEVGAETRLRVQASTRSRAAMVAAFRRECAEHAAATRGKVVVVDWPAEFALDAEVEACLRDMVAVLAPKALACTTAGEHREPFFPEPVHYAQVGDRQTLRIDTEAGKPLELQRAIDRRMPVLARDMRGKAVRVQVVGNAPISRTLLRSVCAAIESAGAMRLEVEDHGALDVLLPPMLTVSRSGADQVRIAAVAEGRDQAQQAQAMQRELDAAALPAGAVVTLAPSAVVEALLAAVIARGAARVLLDGPAPVQVHPPLFGAPQKKGLDLRLPVQPGGDAAMTSRQVERELPLVLAGLGPVAIMTVTIAWPGADAASEPFTKVLQGLVARKAGKVLLDTGTGRPVQVHPPAAAAAAGATSPAAGSAPAAAAAASAPPVPPAAAVATATRATEPAAEGHRPVVVLGRRDGAVPPMILVGVEAGTDPAHIAEVEARMLEYFTQWKGRCVLLVLRQAGQDVPVRREDALVAALRRLLAPVAAATLVFRGPDAQQRPHFQVAHSTVRELPVGAAFADPRRA